MFKHPRYYVPLQKIFFSLPQKDTNHHSLQEETGSSCSQAALHYHSRGAFVKRVKLCPTFGTNKATLPGKHTALVDQICASEHCRWRTFENELPSPKKYIFAFVASCIPKLWQANSKTEQFTPFTETICHKQMFPNRLIHQNHIPPSLTIPFMWCWHVFFDSLTLQNGVKLMCLCCWKCS